MIRAGGHPLHAPVAMSSEKISLQPLGYEEEEEEEKSELGGLQEKLQEDSDCKKAGNQAHRTKTKCRNIFITVTSLFGFAFVNAAVSVILPFYPIEVSLTTGASHTLRRVWLARLGPTVATED